MSEKLFHVRISSRGGMPVNDHFNEDELKVKFKGVYWLQAVLEMDVSAHFEYFTPDTTKESIDVKRVT
jgi:hypothetical protein